MTGFPDERPELELGAALRELPVPPHRAGWEGELHVLLESEAASRAAARRRPGRSRAPRMGPARMARPMLAGIAVVLLAVTLATLPLGDERTGIGVRSASAAQIVERAQTALASLRNLEGTLVLTERFAPDEPVRRSRLRFLATSRGDVRITGSRDAGDVHYDAATATQVSFTPRARDKVIVERGLAPGAPDVGPQERVLQGGLAAVTRALAAAGDASVREETVRGRTAVVLRTSIEVNKLGFSGDHLEVAVDRATGLPIELRETIAGQLVRSLRLEGLRVNRSLGRRAFRPRRPNAIRPLVIDYGFRNTRIEAAAARVEYFPLRPARLPRGFRPAETRTAREAGATGAEGMNPPSRDVISSAYRRGVDRVIVTTRRVGPDRAAWTDPISPGESVQPHSERVRLRRGALAGEMATVVLDPRVTPHVWIVGRRLVVTIAGALSRDELITAAETLTRVR